MHLIIVGILVVIAVIIVVIVGWKNHSKKLTSVKTRKRIDSGSEHAYVGRHTSDCGSSNRFH